ncbi:MAG: sulfotransferase family protein [Pirellulaceae bacterium]|nr:sulfotransferase family protein [Pirellulaceae bacterium]
MISNEHKCIFLHPNKCGGKSVEYLLWGVEPKSSSADHRFINEVYDEYGEENVSGYYKFMFCRNPWERLVSIYHGRKQILKQKLPSFEKFVLKADPSRKPFRAQILWIKYKDRYEVDFIGRFENYAQDWKKVCKVLGIEKELVKLNSSSYLPFKEYYNDRLKDFVAKQYKEDIDFFGYDF